MMMSLLILLYSKIPKLGTLDHIKNHHYRFIQFNIKCNWTICSSDSSTRSPISDITTFSNRNINITTNKLFHWFYSSINNAKKKQNLKLISINEMKIFFRSYFRNITFKHYLDIPKPMTETILNKKLCNNPELIEVLTQIHTPHSYLIPLFFRFHPRQERTKHIFIVFYFFKLFRIKSYNSIVVTF